MILFLYGEDNYRLKQKVKALKGKFISASLGDTNLVILAGKEVSYDEMVRQILAMPFLSRTRLVIIENLLKQGKKDVQEKMAEFLKKVPNSTVLVFVEEGLPDKRTILFKRLIRFGKSQEYKLLEEHNLTHWVMSEVASRGAKIDSNATKLLVEYVGSDLWRLSNELDKLIAYQKQITIESVKLLVSPEIRSDIFKMIDALGAKNFRTAIAEQDKLLKTGANELYILSMIVYQFRNLLVIKDLIERLRHLDRWQIAKKTGIHPYVVQKSLYQSKNFTFDQLKKIYEDLLNFDIAIKTGKMEGKVAITLLIAKFCM